MATRVNDEPMAARFGSNAREGHDWQLVSSLSNATWPAKARRISRFRHFCTDANLMVNDNDMRYYLNPPPPLPPFLHKKDGHSTVSLVGDRAKKLQVRPLTWLLVWQLASTHWHLAF